MWIDLDLIVGGAHGEPHTDTGLLSWLLMNFEVAQGVLDSVRAWDLSYNVGVFHVAPEPWKIAKEVLEVLGVPCHEFHFIEYDRQRASAAAATLRQIIMRFPCGGTYIHADKLDSMGPVYLPISVLGDVVAVPSPRGMTFRPVGVVR